MSRAERNKWTAGCLLLTQAHARQVVRHNLGRSLGAKAGWRQLYFKGTAAGATRGVWNTHCSGPGVCIPRFMFPAAFLTVKPGMEPLGRI
jgi:hypothetical protein